MPLNNAPMQTGANAIAAVIGWAQLHSAAAGGSGTSNLTSAARAAVSWATSTGLGNFGLTTPVSFTGGAANGAVYSATLWSASAAGTFSGEYVLGGDAAFNASGQYAITAFNFTGNAT
jgi:hypothetical protein